MIRLLSIFVFLLGNLFSFNSDTRDRAINEPLGISDVEQITPNKEYILDRYNRDYNDIILDVGIGINFLGHKNLKYGEGAGIYFKYFEYLLDRYGIETDVSKSITPVKSKNDEANLLSISVLATYDKPFFRYIIIRPKIGLFLRHESNNKRLVDGIAYGVSLLKEEFFQDYTLNIGVSFARGLTTYHVGVEKPFSLYDW